MHLATCVIKKDLATPAIILPLATVLRSAEMNSKLLDNATPGQLQAISELISELELNDAENSIRNATRCLNQQGVRELEVMVTNYHYRSGINYIKNEIREILGLPVMRTELEQQQFEYAISHPKGSQVWWNCPELQPHEFEIVEGSAKLIPLGEDRLTLVVIGTKDRKKATRMIRRYQRDWYDNDLLATETEVESVKLVWRKAGEGEGDHTHMFSWSKNDTKNNLKAIHAFVFEGQSNA